MNKFLCIHGHFYQPPRENPWIEEIEIQESAYPYHDWNERVCAECYAPNSYARILDENNKIIDIVNNYSLMSFNCGPTLLSWLQKKAPAVYTHILEADRTSLKRCGHGNAIAQAYSHSILPLANEQNIETEVIWGIEDFRNRFKRYPEAMWLPETAVNSKTLEVLHRFDMKFLLLSPAQAQQVRPLEGGPWHDVSNAQIDPRHPYRCFLKDESGEKDGDRFIDVFFYDGSLAAGISFGNLLYDGSRFAERLNKCFNPDDAAPQLVHVVTDGETYGHHKKYGEMALLYALRRATEHYGCELINYGAFHERFPPQWEVDLKTGPNDEGTSWSCIHGVGRWKADCGCRTSQSSAWNQKWRKPLREALDILRNALAEIFENKGEKYFTCCRDARNDYIRVIMDRSDDCIDLFFTQHGRKGLEQAERVQALKLLEMQRNALLMYTSCGWFFDEISGLEATQILQYADRALQLAETFTTQDIERPFVERLSQAHSNIAGNGTGKDVFYRLVRPCRVGMEKILNHFLISSSFSENIDNKQRIYHYRLEIQGYEKKHIDNHFIITGRVRMKSDITREAHNVFFFLAFLGGYCFRSVIRQMIKGIDYSRVKKDLFHRCKKNPGDILPIMQDFFGECYHYSLRDMFQEERQKILRQLVFKDLESYEGMYANMFNDTRATIKAITKEGLSIPWQFRVAAEHSLSKNLYDEIACLRHGSDDVAHRGHLKRILFDAKEFGYSLDLGPPLMLLSETLQEKAELLREHFCAVHIEDLNDFLTFVKGLPIEFNMMSSQNIVFDIIKERYAGLTEHARNGDEEAGTIVSGLINLAENIDISSKLFS